MAKTRARRYRPRRTIKIHRQRGGQFKVGNIVGYKRLDGTITEMQLTSIETKKARRSRYVKGPDGKYIMIPAETRYYLEGLHNPFPGHAVGVLINDLVYIPVFNTIEQLLDVAENVGSIPAPAAGEINLLTLEEFRHGEDVIILVEKDASGVEHNFMFKKGPLIDWFNGLIRDRRPLVNPLTRTPIIQPGKQLYTRNPAVKIKLGKIEEAEKPEIQVETRKSFKFRLKKSSIPEKTTELEVLAEKPAKTV